ncbi:Outer membrane heme receptor [Komagataeibacter xylinus E25]|nr:Outer membrane heme receptor [Komagataeibacter xylinus E25]
MQRVTLLSLLTAGTAFVTMEGQCTAAYAASVSDVGRIKKTSVVKEKVPEELKVSTRRAQRGAMVTLSASALEKAVPGTNPLKVLAQLPGVMFQSDDPQGVDTWSAQLFMHGFMQNQIGTTLDGMPLGELVYYNYNGLNPVQAISSENVSRLDVSMGAGAESVASTNNLGGSIEYHSSDPKDKLGATVGQTFGSNSTFHTFVRMDSGRLNRTGTKFYVSYMRNDTAKWRGGGMQFMQQVNSKLVQPIGDHSQISAFFDYSDLDQINYQDYTLNMLHTLGYKVDNFYGTGPNSYANAYKAALAAQGLPGGSYPAGYNKLSDPADASYYAGATAIQDYFGGLNLDFQMADHVRWKSVVYGHGESSHLPWTNPYFSSPNGAPITETVQEPSIRRFGVTSAVTYDVAHNHISGGVWYENSKFIANSFGYQEPLLGQGSALDPLGNYSKLTPAYDLWGQTTNTNTFTAFVQDTYNPIHNLSLHFGFKSLLETSRVSQNYNLESFTGVSALASGVGLTTARAFLPHISGDWHFLRHHELFFDISENVHAYPLAGFKTGAAPFAVSQQAYDQSRSSLRPESDWVYSVGYRFTHPVVQASLYAYRANFKNRLQQITSGTIVNPVSSVLNVGGVTMNGVDAGLTLTPIRGLLLYNSVSYDHATYDTNIEQTGTTYYLHGQQVVAYPRFMYKSRLSYQWRSVEAHIDASYMSKRNLSYVGDTKVPAYWLANMGVDYRLDHDNSPFRYPGFLQKIIFSFNVYNLTNTKYISTMGENGYPMNGDYQSILLGAPRQYFGSVRAEF